MSTNKDLLSKILIFTVGATIGSAVTWKVVKTKYEQIAQEEIDCVKQRFSEKYSDIANGNVQPKETDEQKYENILKENGYSGGNDEEPDRSKEVEDVEKPYVISPDEYGEIDEYEQVTLWYHSDGVLVDDDGNVVDDVEEIVGEASLKTFGEYEQDSVFVRNDRMKSDYEILRDKEAFYDSHPTGE